ncbi:MAG: FecR domain-containing protein [Alphaproteobacteria bacterium]
MGFEVASDRAITQMTGADTEKDQARRDEAAEWLARVTRDNVSEADWSAFETWLASSRLNREAFASVEALWRELDRHAAELSPQISEALHPPRRLLPARAIITGLAATLIVALVVTVYMLQDQPAHYADYVTAKGQMQTIALSDGSKVYLNTNSRIAIHMDRNSRRVRMDDAEAAFDVAKDSARPFIISVGDSEIRVVGTEFNVLHHSGKLVVTVERGVVLVKSSSSDEPSRLVVGDRLTHDDGTNAASISKVDPGASLAWRSGQLIYDQAKLADIADDLNRYFSIPIVVEASARAITFSGVLTIDSEDAVLKRLQALLPISVVRASGTFTLRVVHRQQ